MTTTEITTTTPLTFSELQKKIEAANQAEAKAHFAYLLYREAKFRATKPFSSVGERMANRKAIYETFAAYEVALRESLDAGWECFQS